MTRIFHLEGGLTERMASKNSETGKKGEIVEWYGRKGVLFLTTVMREDMRARDGCRAQKVKGTGAALQTDSAHSGLFPDLGTRLSPSNH